MKKFYSVFFVSCILAMLVQMASAQPEPVAIYKFNETSGTVVADASGNGNDAEVNCDTCWTEGFLGGAIKLWGTETVILPADDIAMDNQAGSVAMWIQTDNVTSDIMTLFWEGDNETGGGFGAENEIHVHIEGGPSDAWTGGELSFWAIFNPDPAASGKMIFSDPEKGYQAGTTPVNPILMNDGAWHHVATTWENGGNMAMYIDGADIWDTTAYTPSHNFDITRMVLGAMGNATLTRAYTGKLDDVRIYNEALFPEDVEALYLRTDVREISSGSGTVLRGNYPNPFSTSTTISYKLAADCDVQLDIYNQIGQKVLSLVNERQGYGSQSVTWNGCNENGEKLNTGIYMYRLQAGDQVFTKRLMLIQ